MTNIYRAVFECHLRFASEIFGSASEVHLEELFLLQKRAIRQVKNVHYIAHTEPIFQELKLLKVKDIISFSRSCLVHKFRLGLLPSSFTRNYFEYISEEESSRRDDPLCLKIPILLNKTLARSPYIMICQAWNMVPYEIKIIPKHNLFKKALHSFLISSYNKICSKNNCKSCAKTI